jgi:TonB-dependent SusC/RagA subfamily outer membrane receptor
MFDGKAKVAVPAHGKVSNIQISVDTVTYKTVTDNKTNSNVSTMIIRMNDDKIVEEAKKDPKTLTVTTTDKDGKKTITFVQKHEEKTTLPKDVLYIIDGKEMESGSMKDIDPNTIKSINVLKGETALKLYGEKGKNGVIEITTKKN